MTNEQLRAMYRAAATDSISNGTGVYSTGIGSEAYERNKAAKVSNARARIANQRKPTVKAGGERFKTKYAGEAKKIVNQVGAIVAGIDAIKQARDFATVAGDAEFAALAFNPTITKALDAALKKLARDTQSIIHESAHGDPLVQAGMDAMEAIVGRFENCTPFGPEAVARIESARKRAFDMMVANNPARVALGMDDEPSVGDDVYAGLGRKGARQGEFEGK